MPVSGVVNKGTSDLFDQANGEGETGNRSRGWPGPCKAQADTASVDKSEVPKLILLIASIHRRRHWLDQWPPDADHVLATPRH